jgi:perosamine synthetase
MYIHLSRPDITEAEFKLVKEVLFSQTLSMGPKTKAFEEAFIRFTGKKFALAVSSGTAGLHLLVRSFGINPGDEVITTPFSFISSSNCILFEGATPVFADIEPESLNIDPLQIEAKITPKTKALLPVHVFGHPVHMEKIKELAQKHNLIIIEDACEAIGAEFQGKKAGTLGDAAVFAFYPNKQITTGEGGMIVTDNPQIAGLCRSMHNQGREEGIGWLDHKRLGFNYRMDELSAALGLAQMGRINEIMEKRTQVAQMYHEKLKDIPEITLPAHSGNIKMSWFVYVIRLKPNMNRSRVMQYLLNHGIQCRPYFSCIHLQPYYRSMFGFQPGTFPVAEAVSRSTLALPFYNNLKEEEINYVVKTLKEAIVKL